MATIASEPALDFWLSYAEREGALIEEHHDHAVVVLPLQTQNEAGLPEEVAVTSSPDVARDDGAVLMIAGHPAVEQAATAVLAAGDVGCAYLPWPSSRPPLRSTLEARARERGPVAVGRIDAVGEPIAVYLPVVRVGAMVSYAASLSLRFHEQEEAWVDARSATELSEPVAAAARDKLYQAHPDGPRRVLAYDPELAVTAADAKLHRLAAVRQINLAAHARRALELELARVDSYYSGALKSIERRQTSATDERATLLAAQADATRAEHARRRREIEDEHKPRYEIRPFRLHVVHLPAYLLPIELRRGSRAFPFELAWIPAAGEFASVRCPSCGSPAPLVATREHLGCRDCGGGRSAA